MTNLQSIIIALSIVSSVAITAHAYVSVEGTFKQAVGSCVAAQNAKAANNG